MSSCQIESEFTRILDLARFLITVQAVFETRLKEMAMAVPLMCFGADIFSVPSRKQVVLVGHKSSVEFDDMLAAAHSRYDPNRTVSSRLPSPNPIEPSVLYLFIFSANAYMFLFYASNNNR